MASGPLLAVANDVAPRDRPRLRLVGIGKAFSGTWVLRGATFEVRAGEVVCLVGENGAGKSTLKNILAGLLEPDHGTIEVDGNPHGKLTSRDAERLGIGIVHQELSLFPNLSVAENLFIGRLPSALRPLSWRLLRERARAIMQDTLGTAIDPATHIEDLAIGQRQMVEIAKALNGSSRVLVLDEPTTCLTVPERERLFTVIRRLKATGLGLIYITHFMDEVYTLADRIVVLRDGIMVGDGAPEDIDRRRLGTLMAGRELDLALAPLTPVRDDAPIRLSVSGLADPGLLRNISFDIRAGEILGFAGLVGSGRSEVAESLVGLRSVTAGTIALDGAPFARPSPRAARERGLVLVSEDRRRDQAFLGRSLAENVTAPIADRLANALGLMRPARELAFVGEIATRYRITHPGLSAPMAALSGGNQQKAIIGRWLATRPGICILDEPTKGVDIGARALIHRLVRDLAASGVAILLISSDLTELFAVCHRIAVMHKGEIAATLNPAETDSAAIISLASSGRPSVTAAAQARHR